KHNSPSRMRSKARWANDKVTARPSLPGTANRGVGPPHGVFAVGDLWTTVATGPTLGRKAGGWPGQSARGFHHGDRIATWDRLSGVDGGNNAGHGFGGVCPPAFNRDTQSP